MTVDELKARTKKFAIDIAKLCKLLPNQIPTLFYVRQIIRSSSSVGANYRAACRGKSTADFINKLKIVEEEADETIFFLELILEFENNFENEIRKLIKEGNEILSICVASINTVKKKNLKS
jgi:four helix bundle protein